MSWKFPVFILLNIVLEIAYGQPNQICTIQGEIIDRKSKVLLVRKCSENYNSFMNNPVKIPISNGRFSYKFEYDETEAYELIFEDEVENGNWNSTIFFPTNGVIKIKLYPQSEWKQNSIDGGDLNSAFSAFSTNRDQLFDLQLQELDQIGKDLLSQGKLYNSAYLDLQEQLQEQVSYEEKIPLLEAINELIKEGAHYTETARRLFANPADSLFEAMRLWKYEYIKLNLTLVSYYLIWSDVEMQMAIYPEIEELVANVLPTYQKIYPDHVYTEKISKQLTGFKTVRVGNKYINVKAQSINTDSTVLISSVIQDHIALIVFWGSWCGPCIAKNRLLLTIYHKYKEKGFEIVGIAREFKSTDAVKIRLKKERYPWVNLVDLDDKQNIWNIYGMQNGSGLMVLVDKDGTILSIDPKPSDIEMILQQKLN